MNKQIFSLLLAGIVCVNSTAMAAVLYFSPDQQSAINGDEVWLDLMAELFASDFPTNASDVAISAFDVDILYDPNAIAFKSYEIDFDLGDPINGTLWDLSTGFISPNRIDLAADSFELPADLLQNQGTHVRLARLFFDVVSLPPATLTNVFIDANDSNLHLGNESGDPLTITALHDGVISNGVVPAPATLLLVASGLGLLGLRRR